MVFFALVTAWRLAGAPTRISSLSVYATTEGVVRAPSLFSRTLGLPPSMMATHEFVVPRSMPMIFAMFAVLSEMSELVREMGLFGGFFNGLGDGHQRRAQHAVMQRVALLQQGHDRVGFLVALDLADGLVAVGVELLARGGRHGLHVELVEHRVQLARGELHAFLEGLDRRVLDGERGVQAVLHREQCAREGLDAELVRLGNI